MTVRAYREWERPGSRKWRDGDLSVRVSGATNVSIDWLWTGGYSDGPPSDVPLAIGGAPMPPAPRAVSDGKAQE